MRPVIVIYLVLTSAFLVKCYEKGVFFYTTQDGPLITLHKPNDNNVGPGWITKGLFYNGINSTGFAYLEIETNEKEDPVKQALNAGYLEGSLTAGLIYSQWVNTVDDFCKWKGQKVCDEIISFITANSKWVKEQIKSHAGEPYWDQVMLYYVQIDGMFLGYNSTRPANKALTWYDIFWLNVFYDIMDLYETLGGKQIVGSGSCSVLIKLLPGNEDLYFGHNSWQQFQHMLKIQKKYILKYTKKISKCHCQIPGYEMVLTSYPGTINSQDDFYLISSGLAATETTNEIFNKTLWKYVTPNTLLENVRSMVANRLAEDGKSWNEIYQQHNSGTYNNQWMIVDFKKFKPGKQIKDGLLWVSEQIPSKVIAEDKTDVLLDKGYWSSYNIPYYKEIFDISGYNQKLNELGTWFSHSEAPRAKIFARDQGKVTDMKTFMTLMRSNDFMNDEFARCNCTPPYSGCGAIAARDDLNLLNGTYQFDAQKRRPAGATDAKITNSNLFKNLQFIAVAGPTRGTLNKLPTFKWSLSNFPDVPRVGHPDVWDFEPVLHRWHFKKPKPTR